MIRQIEPAEPGVHWSASALCAQVDPGLFFPTKGNGCPEARRVCLACPVRAECLAEALDRNEPAGMWGGLTTRERRQLQRQAAA
ncbi:WhiB family transcriptional regulator [Streptomyces sp. NPDC101115]|uniref:WhiB family transcriptional regulator n=1 Tax=Streptomyces sp. NPDC101115 TaxID=3366106 RepID=UPI00380D2DE3